MTPGNPRGRETTSQLVTYKSLIKIHPRCLFLLWERSLFKWMENLWAARDDPCICQAGEKTIEGSGLLLSLQWSWIVMHALPRDASGFYGPKWSSLCRGWPKDSGCNTREHCNQRESNHFVDYPAASIATLCGGLPLFVYLFMFLQKVFTAKKKKIRLHWKIVTHWIYSVRWI